MYVFWYDYVKAKYNEKGKFCYMDTDSFIDHVKTDDIYKHIADYVETRFDTFNYELENPLPKGKNKNVFRVRPFIINYSFIIKTTTKNEMRMR